MPAPRLHVVTYNIHKGFSQFNRHMMVHELRSRLRSLGPDLVFLQEVQGLNEKHAEAIDDWPDEPQHNFLAADVWPSTAYGKNAIYDHGHHGNAILSRFPIAHVHNQDITHLRFERRGLLHCSVAVPGVGRPVHCVCVHLSLFARSRRRQMAALVGYLDTLIGPDAPLIIAGDFNDWRNEADDLLARELGLEEVFGGSADDLSHPGRSFPSKLPVLRLDRIYVRGFVVDKAIVHFGRPWSKISDHAAVSGHLSLAPQKTPG